MTDPFLAEIRMFAGNFAPTGWALCSGQLMPISQNTALFSLLGTTYGGDGRTTFQLPNLQGAAPLQQGQGPGLSSYALGQNGGATSTRIDQTQIPSHSHTVAVSTTAGTSNVPTGGVLGQAAYGRRVDRPYAPASTPADAVLNHSTVGVAGSSQPHNNMPPYLTVTFIIALQGVFPQRP